MQEIAFLKNFLGRISNLNLCVGNGFYLEELVEMPVFVQKEHLKVLGLDVET